MLLLAAAAAVEEQEPGTGGWHITVPQSEFAFHGAGYPITYRFTVPDQPGLTAQWRGAETPWRTLAVYGRRFDGVNAARFSGTDAFLSVTFPHDDPNVWLRVVDAAGVEVGTFSEVCPRYDDRVPVIFTYDDTPSAAPAVLAAHREARLWASVGIISSSWGDLDPAEFAADVAAGYVEPINHSYSHLSPTTYADLAEARQEVLGGAAGILAVTPMPPQSRGRVHGFIIPYGNSSTHLRTALGESSHLAFRTTGGPAWSSWPTTVGDRAIYQDGWSVQAVPIANTPYATYAEYADSFIAAIDEAKLTPERRCILYTYPHRWPSHAPGSDFWRYVTTIGARQDIWSVGYGHYALYLRTASRVTVTPPA